MVLLISDEDLAKVEITPAEYVKAVEDGYRQDGLGLVQDTPREEVKIKGKHLPHIARSSASQGKTLVVTPARCLKCGFVFEGRRRFTRPSRCPRCRETYMQSPTYTIRNR